MGSEMCIRDSHCMQCARENAILQGQSYGQPPDTVLQPMKSGENIMFDILGPVYCIHNMVETRKSHGRYAKRYIMVLYDLNTHFVLYRLCMDRTRSEVLKCLEQYNCLFGPIKEVWADNAQEFHSTDILLRRYSVDPEFLNKHGDLSLIHI